MDDQQFDSCDQNNTTIFGNVCCGDKQNCELLIETCEKGAIEKQNKNDFYECPKNIKRKKVVLSTLDILISLFVVTPLVVACWRGTWQLMDIYFYHFPPWESFLIGIGVHIVIAITQESFHETINKNRKNWALNAFSFIFMKIYTILFNVITNLHWRGGWMIVDDYFGVTVNESGQTSINRGIAAFLFFGSCFLIMFFMKCLRNLNSPPFEISLDYGEDMFLFPNRFKVKVSEKMPLYILDVIFSVGIVTTLGVFVWRGMWLIVDLYFFSDDPTLSTWASVFLGYLVVAIVFLLQPLMKKWCDKLSGVPKLLVADGYILFSMIGVITVWRGIWNLINIYFLPDTPELSCWLSHWISLLILIAMGCSNSVLVRGVNIDAEEPNGECVVFPCHYLRVMFLEEKRDTWFSIWSGKNEDDGSTINNKNVAINYQIVNMNNIKFIESNNNNNYNKI